MARIALAAAALLALAACDRIMPAISGSGAALGDGFSNLFSNEPPSYGATTPGARAEEGCASGQHADFLHQNRPGGNDFSASRCAEEGY